MKRLFLLSIICMVACISCKKGDQANERILSKSEVIQGTTFSAGSSIRTKDKGLLAYVTLGADQTVADVNFSKAFPYVFKKGTTLEYQDSIVFEKPEMPSVITIQEKHTIMGFDLPAGTRILPGVASGTFGGQPVYSVMYTQIQPGDALDIKGKKFNVGDYIQIYPNNVIKYFDKGVEKNL